MNPLKKSSSIQRHTNEKSSRNSASVDGTSANGSRSSSLEDNSEVSTKNTPPLAYFMGGIASLGGFLFGYESGQISGFQAMSDFLNRFGENGKFTPVRSGTIVAMLSAGTLIGCLGSPLIADTIGRKRSISASSFFYIIGVVIEITSSKSWIQFAMGRFVAGLGIGALSTVVPMYQSESIPRAIRGAVVSSYQLMITLGIWVAYMVNFGTSSSYIDSAQWRIPNGLSALWAVILGTAILFMPESPRFAYRIGRVEEARKNMARLNGVAIDSEAINLEIAEIEEKQAAESAGGSHPWYEIFTGPKMLRRTLLGMGLQAGQQLTGANYFFYYGTTIFASVGLSNSYVTSIILGSVNVAATIVGLWLGLRYGRRNMLMIGAAVMCVCFLIFAFVGHFELYNIAHPSASAGNVLIVFTCFFICAFATTWGPLVWAVVGELYPARYRATCMALATASNWLLNFLISFFSTFIANEINYYYGLVFGGCCLVLIFVVYFFVIESKERSLEEIDTMYMIGVVPWKSARWDASSIQKDGLINTDNMHLAPGGRGKAEEVNHEGLMVHDEAYGNEETQAERKL